MVARAGGREIPFERVDNGVRLTVDGAAPAVDLEAKGFATIHVDLNPPPEPDHQYEINRAEGTLTFGNVGRTDYPLPVARMIETLPEESAYVKVERFPRTAISKAKEMRLPTGVYQVSLQGEARAVQARPFGQVTIQPEATTHLELPLTMVGSYAGEVTPQGSAARGAPGYRLELAIEPGLEVGTFVEQTRRGTRRAPINEGRLDGEGTFVGRIRFSVAQGGEAGFDQLFTLKRGEGGAVEFEASEAPDTNPPIEQHLGRIPFPKESFLVKGTLRAAGGP
jgi:hypothetical protein